MSSIPSSEKKAPTFIDRSKFFENLSPEDKYPFQLPIWTLMIAAGQIAADDETVQVVHEILYNQMKLLLHEAEKVALMRREKSKDILETDKSDEILEIVHGDILFLMRPHKVKIKRLLEYLSVMDNRPSYNNTIKNDEDTSFLQSKTDNRVNQCLQFFAEIEDCEEFTSILKDNIVDVELKRKLERRKLMTEFMTDAEYKRYHDMLPKATFCYKGGQGLFKYWLLHGINIFSRPADISRLAITILEFLARETISNIVDMAYHIKEVNKNKMEKVDDYKMKVRCSALNMKIFDLPGTDKGKEDRKMPIDARIIGEKVVTGLTNELYKNAEKISKGECISVELPASDFSADFKAFYIYQSLITREDVIDAYMQFQIQRKPWLYFGDPFLKNPTLICLTNVDDHKVP